MLKGGTQRHALSGCEEIIFRSGINLVNIKKNPPSRNRTHNRRDYRYTLYVQYHERFYYIFLSLFYLV